MVNKNIDIDIMHNKSKSHKGIPILTRNSMTKSLCLAKPNKANKNKETVLVQPTKVLNRLLIGSNPNIIFNHRWLEKSL